MNQRIQRLLEESTVQDPQGTWQVDPIRFAELIVRECAGVCSERSQEARALKVDRENSARAILAHFDLQ